MKIDISKLFLLNAILVIHKQNFKIIFVFIYKSRQKKKKSYIFMHTNFNMEKANTKPCIKTQKYIKISPSPNSTN